MRRIVLAAATAALALPACATSVNPADMPDAVLLDAGVPSVREAIRVFVREDAGGSYRTLPDSLADGPELAVVAIQTASMTPGMTPPIDELLVGNIPQYRLKMGKDSRCHLMRVGGTEAVLTLPSEARCRAV